MKCIKSIKETKSNKLGQILRTSDDDAKEKVRGGFWVYVQKSEWKGSKTNQTEQSEVQVEKKKKGKSKKELKTEKKIKSERA